jgi:tRNA pseudouridine synthase 10
MEPSEAGEAAARAILPEALRACAEWEFRSYLVGTKAPSTFAGEAAEAFRKAANRTLGNELGMAWGGARLPEFHRPEAHIFARPEKGEVEVKASPLFVYGRYRKHSRDLAQTPYHCPICRGRGCGNCGRTGRMVAGSLSEILVPVLVEASGAEEGIFKGCGREDGDVRMLGAGRPFVVELRRPHRRSLDWEGIAKRASSEAAEFPVLYPVAIGDGEKVPAAHGPKRYLARVEVEGGATAADAERVAAGLRGATLAQRTPERVSKRRADLVRERKVLDATARLLPDGALELTVRTEAGAYIKEMITGDGGRTVPSCASLLGRPCVCAALDVLDVELLDPPRLV